MTETQTTVATSTPETPEKKRKKPGPPAGYTRIPHPLLLWVPDGGSGLMGMRSRTVMVRVAWNGKNYTVVPTFPLPRGTKVTGADFDDLDQAKRVAETFFRKWLVLVGLETTDILVPAKR